MDKNEKLLESFCLIILCFNLIFFQALVNGSRRKRKQQFSRQGVYMEFQWVNCHCSHHIITCFFLRDPSLIWNTDGLNCRQLWLYLKSCLCFLQINQQTCWLVTKNRIQQFAISVMLNNRPFLHSYTYKQWHRVEVRVDKNTPNVWKCPPQPRSGAIVCARWRGMQERSIIFG